MKNQIDRGRLFLTPQVDQKEGANFFQNFGEGKLPWSMLWRCILTFTIFFKELCCSDGQKRDFQGYKNMIVSLAWKGLLLEVFIDKQQLRIDSKFRF